MVNKSAAIHIPRHMQAAPTATQLRSDDHTIFDADPDTVRLDKTESWIARNILAVLDSTYRDRTWRITVDALNGVIMLQAPLLDSEKGYFMHMKNKTIHDLCEQAKKAGGEVLERFNVTRAKNWNPEKLEDLGRSARGNAIGPDSQADSITGSGKTLKEGER